MTALTKSEGEVICMSDNILKCFSPIEIKLAAG